MRPVLAWPFSLIPASRMLEFPDQARSELGADFVHRFLDSKVARLLHLLAGLPTRFLMRTRIVIQVDFLLFMVMITLSARAEAVSGKLVALIVLALRCR